jgi:tetratricopeptide (TPR) repeat protein
VIEPGRTDDRRAALAAAIAARPDDPAPCTELGRLELRAGEPARAEELLRRALAAEATAERHELLGTALLHQGRRDEALAALRAALELEPERASAWNTAGKALGALGRIPAAADAFLRAARSDPGFAAAHGNLGLALSELGRYEEAVVALERAVRLDGRQTRPLHALARSLQLLGRYEDAGRCYARLVELAPDDALAHNGLGAVAQLLGDFQRARDCYLRALELAPRFADAHSNLGSAWQGLREPERAVASYREALAIQPAHEDAAAGLASVLDHQGRYEESLDFLRPRLDGPAASPELTITAAQTLRHLDRSEEAVTLLEALLERPSLPAAARLRALFTLGNLRDDLGDYARAFAHFRAANDRKPVRFDRAEYLQDVERLLDVFDPATADSLPRLDERSERPVFVLGMPRSGTSLVEQILACHPQVAGAGELTDLGRLAIGLGGDRGVRFPDSMRSATAAELRAAAADYLAVLARVDPDALRVVDKTPANQLFVGFIARLFPRARIIHCVRHPLDTALSCYMQNFGGQGIPYAYDLADLALYYNHYLRVMALWRQDKSLRLFEVVYEELVLDQERVSRELIDFLGLPWDPACLDFHRSGRDVQTASHAQVRRALYRSAVGRHRHYDEELQGLRDALDWPAWQASGLADRVAACHERCG